MRWVFTALLLVGGFASAQTPAVSQLTRPPSALQPKVSGPKCTFPAGALRAGIDERTLLEFRIGTNGQITDVVVNDSSGNADLNQAAIRCFNNWRADPSEATGFGTLRAHIWWNSPAGASRSPIAIPVGTFTVNRLQTCEPFYPTDKLRADIGGLVKLEFTITEQGNVTNPTIIASSGYPDLDAAALVCVPHWRYRPAIQDGTPIAVRWKADVSFFSALWSELARNAMPCLRDAVMANQALVASAGRTQLSVRLPATGPAQVSVMASSGNALLDRLATECYSKTAPQPGAIQQQENVEVLVERNYRIYVPWKDLLSLFARSPKRP